uniref:Anoctamin n=1 Tax=Macrostomum lignano TaxID=282301 RepID=A0A1I8H3E3_9PLAT
MQTDRPDADYVLFYAKVRSFLEDGCCTLKHTCRRVFEKMATERGLTIEKYSMDFGGAAAPAAQNGSATRRRRGASKAAYRTFYWAFRASDAALMSEAEFVQLRLPLKDHAGNPMATGDRLVEHWGCGSACCSAEAADGDCDQEQPLDDKRHFITAPFVHSKRHMFFGGAATPLLEKPDAAAADGFEDGLEAKKAAPAGVSIALTEAQRIYLTHSLLHRMDMRKELRRVLGPHPGAELCAVDCIYCRRLKRRIIRNEPIVLEHLLDARIFADGFAMHEDSEPDWLRAARNGKPCASGCCLCGCCGRSDNAAVSPEDAASTQELPELGAAAPRGGTPQGNRTRGLRRRLHRTWNCCCSFQSLRHIRLYFGERLAFYYAWLSYHICSLVSLTVVGLAFLVYGLVNASMNYMSESDKILMQLKNSSSNSTDGNAFTIHLIQLMQFIRLVFENHLTIPFGCVLTGSSLANSRYWKKFEADLSHRWGVHEFRLAEQRRAGFAPKKRNFYPAWCQRRNECRRCFGVFSFVLLCVSLVVAVAVAFRVSKLVASKQHCSGASSRAECIFLAIILPITGHLLVMGLLDWAYSCLAKKLTNWEQASRPCPTENHEFDSDHEASYAMKAFALRCANNFASLFYIAFEHAVFGEFTDRCKLEDLDIDCFSLLNVYTAGYIIGKSLLKVIMDLLKPCLSSRSLMLCLSAPTRHLLCTACASFKRASYDAELRIVEALERQLVQDDGALKCEEPGSSATSGKASAAALHLASERNLTKEKSRDVLMDEYLEKTILRGYLLLFGSACHVTPLAVLITLLIDLCLDSKRLVVWQRRAVPQPAPGVGVWNRLHDMLSHAGVFSTGAILAFTSNSLQVNGIDPSVKNRLIMFIVFTGFMYLFNCMVTACSKAHSNRRKMRLKWEYHHVPRILNTEAVSETAVQSLEETAVAGTMCCFRALPARSSCGRMLGLIRPEEEDIAEMQLSPAVPDDLMPTSDERVEALAQSSDQAGGQRLLLVVQSVVVIEPNVDPIVFGALVRLAAAPRLGLDGDVAVAPVPGAGAERGRPVTAQSVHVIDLQPVDSVGELGESGLRVALVEAVRPARHVDHLVDGAAIAVGEVGRAQPAVRQALQAPHEGPTGAVAAGLVRHVAAPVELHRLADGAVVASQSEAAASDAAVEADHAALYIAGVGQRGVAEKLGPQAQPNKVLCELLDAELSYGSAPGRKQAEEKHRPVRHAFGLKWGSAAAGRLSL